MDMTKAGNVSRVDTVDDLCEAAQVEQPAPHEGVMLIVCSKEGHIRAHVLRMGILTEGRLEMAQMTLYKACIAARARACKPIPEGMMEGDNVVV